MSLLLAQIFLVLFLVGGFRERGGFISITEPAKLDDEYTPHPPPIKWYALGDSYTAGPGAGQDFDHDKKCKRNNGSWAMQMHNEFPFNVPNEMTFLACTADTTEDMLKRMDMVKQDDADFMVMTIGANDMDFYSIVKFCIAMPNLFGLPKKMCNKAKAKTKELIAGGKLEHDIHAAYDAIFSRMKQDKHYQLYHVLYARYFESGSGWCDKKSFDGFPFQPKMKPETRQEFNVMTNSFNARIKEIAQHYIDRKRAENDTSWSEESRLIVVDLDEAEIFKNHRFCGAYPEKLENPAVWFFGTLDKDAKPENFRRDLLQKLFPFEFLAKSLHPKSRGHQAIKELMMHRLQENRPGHSAI